MPMSESLKLEVLSQLEGIGDHIYDTGFADGVASVPTVPGGFTQADIDAAVLASKDALKASMKDKILALDVEEDAKLTAEIDAL